MALQLLINRNTNPQSDYITWTPTPCQLLSTENNAMDVLLSNKLPNHGGQVSFMDGPPFQPKDTMQLTIPANGSVNFFITGKFNLQTGVGFHSTDDKDTIIKLSGLTGENLGEKSLMVRVRKNANKLSVGERDRFLDAIVQLNQARKYVELQNMHRADNIGEIHGRSSFLPWHRAFLLDLERKLQEINPAVTIPYWAFDQPAPNVFTRDFIGIPDTIGMVDFSNSNPLINWKLQLFGDGNGTRVRRYFLNGINPAFARAAKIQNNERQTLGLGNTFELFTRRRDPGNQFDTGGIEGDPHANAHSSFLGQISEIGRAPADPLFFLLHCNVDRIWAKWQWLNDRFDPFSTDAYPRQGAGNPTHGGELGIGNFTADTMWPWNNEMGIPRPPHSPGTGMPNSPLTSFPGSKPSVGNCIDYQGQISLGNNLHYAYQDVPFEL